MTDFRDECWSDCYRINFGALPMPDGYEVWWHGEVEMYIAHGPGYESPITCNRFQARRWCLWHSECGN